MTQLRSCPPAVLVAITGVIALLLSFTGPAQATRAASPDQSPVGGHREVVLERTGDTFRVISQAVRPSKASFQHVGPGRWPGYQVKARTQDGRLLATYNAARNSRVQYDYRPEGARNGKLAGGTVTSPDGRVVVQLPLASAIERLEITGGGVNSLVELPPLTTAQALPAAAPATTTIVNNGDVTSHVDVAFVGDGYTSSELPTYQADVQRFTDHLFSQAPFSHYQDFFNVHRVDLVSNESGTDNNCTGTYVDTALMLVSMRQPPTAGFCTLTVPRRSTRRFPACRRQT